MPKGNTEAFDLSVIIGQIAVRLQHFRPAATLLAPRLRGDKFTPAKTGARKQGVG